MKVFTVHLEKGSRYFFEGTYEGLVAHLMRLNEFYQIEACEYSSEELEKLFNEIVVTN